MKVDKDLLIKHHFWIMLGVAVPLALVAILMLMTAVSASIASQRKSLEDEIKKVKGTNVDKNDEFVSLEEKLAAKKKEQEGEVHALAYNAQKSISTWPDLIEKTFNFRDGLFATEVAVHNAPPAGWPAEGPKDDPNRLVHGIVKDIEQDFMIVQTADKKDQRFQRHKHTKAVLVDNGNAAGHFLDISKGTWVAVQFYRSKYFNDPLTPNEQTEYDKCYHSQIAPIIEQVMPMNNKGEGVVQLKSWAWEKDLLPPPGSPFFIYKPGQWNLNIDISEETWLAQEDLWIQRELYRLIRLANDYVSLFKRDEGTNGSKTGTFSNPYWKIEMKLAGNNKLDLKITNLRGRRQKLDVSFLVKLDKTAPAEKILIGGEPLNPKGTAGTDSRDVTIDLPVGLPRTGIFGLEQVLTWETAAVKRIDQIAIGSLSPASHSHRTYPMGVRALRDEKPVTQAPTAEGETPTAQAAPSSLSPNGLNRTRYVQVTPQARRLPVGITLIVDQDHVDRVQAAFNNSYLRFITTQVLINRYPQSMRPQTLGLPATPNPETPGINPLPEETGAGGSPESRPTAALLAGLTTGDDQEANIELSLYGIISLYERYPPRAAPAP